MFKLPLEDFKEEIKAEMYGYEEITDDYIKQWFEVFDNYVRAKKKSEHLSYTDNRVEVEFKDESDLFMIVDSYLAAITNNEISDYFTNWVF